MAFTQRSCYGVFAALIAASVAVPALGSSTSVATYDFKDTLAPVEVGPPSLVAVDPLNVGGFTDAIVAGINQRVYQWGGANDPISDQGGLTLSTAGLVSGDDYSVELVFRFFDREDQWRRILDVKNRSSDTGFYIEPGNHLNVYNDVTGSSLFTNNVFTHAALTVAPDGTTKGYLNGVLEFTVNSTTMQISADNIMALFIDNNLGGAAQTEWSAGQIAFFHLFSGQLSDEQIAADAAPFTPAPGAGVIALLAGAMISRRRR